MTQDSASQRQYPARCISRQPDFVFIFPSLSNMKQIVCKLAFVTYLKERKNERKNLLMFLLKTQVFEWVKLMRTAITSLYLTYFTMSEAFNKFCFTRVRNLKAVNNRIVSSFKIRSLLNRHLPFIHFKNLEFTKIIKRGIILFISTKTTLHTDMFK